MNFRCSTILFSFLFIIQIYSKDVNNIHLKNIFVSLKKKDLFIDEKE